MVIIEGSQRYWHFIFLYYHVEHDDDIILINYEGTTLTWFSRGLCMDDLKETTRSHVTDTKLIKVKLV